MNISAIVKSRLPKPIRRVLREVRGKIRAFRVYPALRRSPRTAIRYLLFDREVDNFTYDIANRDELATFLGAALGREADEFRRYIEELDADAELRGAIDAALAAQPGHNRHMQYGRRLGWYAAARAVKPHFVVETGVHDGLGSAVLLRALQLNSDEGSDGTLLSFDVRDEVGWLVPDWLRSRYELRIGDAIKGLGDAAAGRSVDMFIHDSDHRYEHEMGEFETVNDLASPSAVLISDNAHRGTHSATSAPVRDTGSTSIGRGRQTTSTLARVLEWPWQDHSELPSGDTG